MRAARRTRGTDAVVATAALFLFHGEASAADPGDRSVASVCRFREHAQTLSLLGDCTTETSIVIPDGFTLDGQHHRITALDPRGGSFRGAVIRNAGEEAHVRDVVVRAVALSPRCASAGSDALVGIAFSDCSGSIIDSRVEGVYRRGSACDEGTGIAARASDTSAAGTPQRTISITGNQVERFGETAVSVTGPLSAVVQLNRIAGNPSPNHHPQYGVRLSRGATGDVRWNDVRALAAGGHARPSAGLLVRDTPGPVELSMNYVEQSDVGVALEVAGGVHVANNVLHALERAAVHVDGRRGPSTDNEIVHNTTRDAPTAVLFEGAGSRMNSVLLGPSVSTDNGVRELAGARDNSVADAK